MGVPRDAEGAEVVLLLKVEVWRGRAEVLAAVGSNRGKGHRGWRSQ